MIDERCVSEYCYEDPSLIENYEKAMNDKTQTWVCHHRVGAIMNCGAKELIAQGCYTDRPAHDLIFLTRAEHNKLHNTGKKHSDKTRAKMSASRKGWKPSAETCAKMSEAKSGENNPMHGKHHSEETCTKMSEANSGENNPFFGRRHSEKSREKMSATRIGERLGWHFWNNGIENRYCKECPGPEWKLGKLRKKQS